MIRIGEFSQLAKTTVKTLRFYDEIGLFKPKFVDDNGYRYYTVEQLNVLQHILQLRALNMPLDEIKQAVFGGDIMQIFELRLAKLEEELERNKLNISLIKDYMAQAEKGDFMNKYQANVVTLPKCIVYYRKGVIDSMKDLTTFVLQAGEEAKKNNPSLKCCDYCFVTYGAQEYKEKDVELEYDEAVEEFGKESKNIKFKELPSQKAISVMHKGAYSQLGEAYAFALGFVKEKGYEICGQIRERYINGCWDKDDEKDYLTEIQVPVK